jgi:hypothetical protein
MVLHLVTCENCDQTRPGWQKDGEFRPLRQDCYDCGAEAFTVPQMNKSG